MPIPHLEVASGTIDGVNTAYTTSVAYQAGTLVAILNGQIKRGDFDDGWTEDDPSLGTFSMKEAPRVGDVVQVFFIDTTPALPGEEITPLTGVITEGEDILGVLDDGDAIEGLISEDESLLGVLESDDIQGIISDEDDLIGIIGDCP